MLHSNHTDKKEYSDLEEALQTSINPLVSLVKTKLEQADRGRFSKASQWLKNLAAYRGEDSGRSLRPESEVASIYVRTTATKTKAAYAQLTEATLSGDKYPFSILPTHIPEGIAEFAHLKEGGDTTKTEETAGLNVGFAGDGQEIPPGARQAEVAKSIIGSAYSKGLQETMFVEGNDAMGSGVQLSPAKRAARKMEKMIHDQLETSKAKVETRRAFFELCMLGTGAMKGPFTDTKVSNQWIDGKHQMVTKKVPTLKFVSLWDLYIDPNAFASDDIEYLIERHRMNATQFNELSAKPLFDKEAIARVLLTGGNYQQRTHDHTIREHTASEAEQHLFEVLEFWGYIDSKLAVETYKLSLPKGTQGTVQINAWVSGNEVIRITVNPFKPARIPYFLFPYEEDPYSIYGTGIPELMEDLQFLMNGMARLAVENAMLAGNVMLDVDKQALSSTEDMKIYPGKIWERQISTPGTAIKSIEIPFVAHQNMQMFSQFRQMADEATGLASILHGQTGVTGTGRTASGLSMLMDSASMAIKSVIRNIDDHLFKPVAQAFFQWNMQFNTEEHPEIKGDLDIRPLGSFNLLSKERKAQGLQTFLQLSTNQALAPLIRLPTIVKELAIQLDMDPEEILNSPEEALVYVKLQAMSNPQGNSSSGQAPQGGMGTTPSPTDAAFTGNNESSGNTQGFNGQ